MEVPLYEGGQPVSSKTARTYHKELALHKYVGIKKSVATKTLPRIVAKNSLCSVTSFLLTVAATHFIFGKAPKDHLSISKKGTRGAQSLIQLMEETLGCKIPFYPKQKKELDESSRDMRVKMTMSPIYVTSS
eukprot:2143587-Ditylum_brightwellii.AAC.1